MEQELNNMPKCVFLYLATYLNLQEKSTLKKLCKKFNGWIVFGQKDFAKKYMKKVNKVKNDRKKQCFKCFHDYSYSHYCCFTKCQKCNNDICNDCVYDGCEMCADCTD